MISTARIWLRWVRTIFSSSPCFELVEQAVELAHRFADGRELGVGDSDAAAGSLIVTGTIGTGPDGSVGSGVDVLSAVCATLRLV